MNTLVSIITPLYNSRYFISETIKSVINQTYSNWELILVDDCSTDDTLNIIAPFLKEKPNITLLRNATNQGAAISRNRGINIANGYYIAFLDADDLWYPEKLERQLKFMQTETIDVCFSSYVLIDEMGKPLHKLVKALPVLSYDKLLKSNYVGNLTGIYCAGTLGKITSPDLRKRQDWLLWLAAIRASGKAAKSIQEPLAMYRVREGSMSSNKFNLLKYNYWVYKKGLAFSTLKSVGYMLLFLYEYFFIKSKQVVFTKKK